MAITDDNDEACLSGQKNACEWGLDHVYRNCGLRLLVLVSECSKRVLLHPAHLSALKKKMSLSAEDAYFLNMSFPGRFSTVSLP